MGHCSKCLYSQSHLVSVFKHCKGNVAQAFGSQHRQFCHAKPGYEPEAGAGASGDPLSYSRYWFFNVSQDWLVADLTLLRTVQTRGLSDLVPTCDTSMEFPVSVG